MTSASSPWLIAAVLACLLCSCATAPTPAGPRPDGASGTPRAGAADPSEDPAPRPSRPPRLVPERHATVAPDLRRLAGMFVRYAVGDSDTFPHRGTVSVAIGGRAAASIDDVGDALSNRRVWRSCPADREAYGASSCPVDLLGPVRGALANGARLVHSDVHGDVMCAPTRTGPPAPGRLVVLRPSRKWRTCATDFALALVADGRGRLRAVDLTLSAP